LDLKKIHDFLDDRPEQAILLLKASLILGQEDVTPAPDDPGCGEARCVFLMVSIRIKVLTLPASSLMKENRSSPALAVQRPRVSGPSIVLTPRPGKRKDNRISQIAAVGLH
jgi:hypothetical protein